MQSATDAPREDLDEDSVTALIEAVSLTVTPGLELVNANGSIGADISDRLVSGTVARNNYADIHSTVKFRLQDALDWGAARVRPYMTLSDGTTEARFNLGVYVLDTPERVLGTTPEEYEVEGYDLLAILRTLTGESYSVASGDNVVDTVEALLTAHGAGAPFSLVQASSVTASVQTWPLDTQTTWLGIINELLGSIGYRGLWVDWDGRYRSEPLVSPSARGVEWTYDADSDSTTVGEDRSVLSDFFEAPNHWVFIRNNPAVGLADGGTTDGSTGVYEVTNQSDGPTSIDQRGRTITSVEEIDAVDQASLVARGNQVVDRDKRLDVTVNVTAGPNPLHWHFDIVEYSDSAYGGSFKSQVHSWSLPLDGADMSLVLRKV